MINRILLIFILLSLTAVKPTSSLLSWLFGEKSEEQDRDFPTRQQTAESALASRAPFEMKTADEKFLMEANFVKDLSPLDVCHHRVIARLRETCTKLNEEQVAKLSVNLLNCQSDSEGRKTFTCTDDMTIADCTRDMDPTTWNAYQIVSNRARAICYSVSQTQFRYRTEATVNRLISTTSGQIDAIKQIKESQDELKQVTSDTLTQMSSSQKQLMSNQDRLKASQSEVTHYIAGNLRELVREKSLIAAGNKELAQMTESIREKLDDATRQLSEQGSEQRDNHHEIIADLLSIRDKAREVWDKLDNSSKDVLSFQNETTEHYKQTLENLAKVNQTVNFVVDTLEDTRETLETKLNWTLSLLGGTGDKLSMLWVIVVHVLYFLLAAISATFLQTPAFSRILLLTLVPLNAWSEIKHGTSLGFLPMTMFILLTVIVNWSLQWSWYMYSCMREKVRSGTPQPCSVSPVLALPPTTPRDIPDAPLTPNVQRLLSCLEKMCQTEVVSPGESDPPLSMISFLEAQVTSPNAEELPQQDKVKSFHLGDDSFLHADKTQPLENQDQTEAKLDLVKRHLLRTLETGSPRRSPRRMSCDPVFMNNSESPSPSYSSTPVKLSPRGSRSSTPRRTSYSPQPKPQCLATAKSGRPCRLSSMDGSAFCHRHQVDTS